MSKFLKAFDIYGTSVNWNVKNESPTRSLLGSFFSISLIGVLCYIAWNSGKDMIYKTLPTVDVVDYVYSERPLLNLNVQSFPIAIACQDFDQNNFFDPQYFKLEVFHFRSFSTNSTAIKTQLQLVNCEFDHFPQFNRDYVNKSGLLNYKCIDNYNVSVGKYWDESEIQYLSIRVALCNNETSGESCAKMDQIQQLLSNSPTPISLKMYIKDSIINIENFENPLSSVMISLYKAIDLFQYKMYTINIRQDDMTTDSGIFQTIQSGVSTIVYDSSDYDSTSITAEKVLIEMDIFVANHKKIIHRRYLKAFELFATLGGLAKFFYAIFSFLIYYYSQMIINIQLLNQLFDYEVIDHYGTEDFKDSGRAITEISNNNYVKSIKAPTKIDLQAMWKSNKAASLSFTYTELICILPCMRLCTSHKTKLKWKLYKSTQEILKTRLDVSQVLLSIQEFNKFKEIFLSNEQLQVFNYIARELQNANSKKEHEKTKQSIFNVVEQYAYKSSVSQNEYSNIIEERLHKMLFKKLSSIN